MRNSEKSCVYIPQVMVDDVDKNGVSFKANRDSILFHQLMDKYPKDRERQVRLYGIATDPKFKDFVEIAFMELFQGDNGYTEQGEINLATLLDILGEKDFVDSKSGFAAKVLSEEFEEIEFDGNEEGFARGINAVARFNEKDDYRRMYKAQLYSEGKRYKIRLVNWNSMNKEDKTKFIGSQKRFAQREEAKHKIIRILADQGVDVQYMDEQMEESLKILDEKVEEDQSAIEAGYRATLGIRKGSNDTHFYIRAGFFAIYSLGRKNNAVDRLREIISKDDDLLKAIVSEIEKKDPVAYNTIQDLNGVDKIKMAQEVALAYLIGQSMQREAESVLYNIPVVGSFARLIRVVVNTAGRFFAVLFSNNMQQRIERNYFADQISRSLLQGEVGDAVLNRERVMSYGVNSRLLPSILDARAARERLKEAVKEMKQRSDKTGLKGVVFGELDQWLSNMSHLDELDEGDREFFVKAYKEKVLVELQNMLAILDDGEVGLCSRQLCEEIEAAHSFGESMQLAGDRIKGAEQLVRMMLEVMDTMGFDEETEMSQEFIKGVKELKSELDKRQDSILKASQIISARMLSNVIGADYVAVTLGKKFWGRSQSLKDLGITASEAERYKVNNSKYVIPVKTLLNNTRDVGWFEKAFIPMGRLKDLTMQMIDIYNRKRQDEVREKTIQRSRKLTEIYQYAQAHDVDMSQFYERVYDSDKDGHKEVLSDKNSLTGNFIAEAAYSAYDRDVNEFRKRCWETFKKDRGEVDVEDNAQYELNSRYEWNKFWMESFEAWNLGLIDGLVHGWRMEVDGRTEWVPCTKEHPGAKSIFNKQYYDNYRYEELFGTEDNRTEQQQHNYNVYKNLTDLKVEIDDDCLDYGATRWYRAPQFKGTTLNQTDNRGTVIGAADAVMKKLVQRYLDDSDAIDFGDDNNHEPGVGDYDPFNTARRAERHLMERVPLYGINKLRDMKTLSTDPIQTLKAYSYMAENYKATKDYISALELYKDVVSSNGGRSKQTITPRKKERLEAYFRSNFYGTGIKPKVITNQDMTDSFNRKLEALNTRYGVRVFDKFQLSPTAFVVTQAVTAFNGLASLYFLGGNLHSATMNLLSGKLRLAAEGIKGEHYTRWELAGAVGIWMWTKMLDLIWHGRNIYKVQTGKYLTPPTKLSLLQEYLNTRNNYDNEQRHSHAPQLSDAVEGVLMFGYELGDDFMSTVGYVAAAMHTKVITSDGKKQSLWKSLKVVNGYGQHESKDIKRLWKVARTDDPGEGVYTLALDGPCFSTKERKTRYEYINNVLRDIANLVDAAEGETEEERYNNVSLYDVKVLLEKQNRVYDKGKPNEFERVALIHYLAAEHVLSTTEKHGSEIEEIYDIGDVIEKLVEYRESQTFNEDDLSKFRYNCNMLNVGMHGVYNSTDKATFQNSVIGCMISTLKGYAFGYVMREFLDARVNVGGGKALTFDEFCEKYGLYAEEVDKSTIRDMGSMLNGDYKEMANLYDESELQDMVNIRILDTDIVEGTMVSCVKMWTSPSGWALTFAGLLNAVASYVPFANQKIRQRYLNMANNMGWTDEQANNRTREWGLKMLLYVMSIFRVLLCSTIPPPEESEEEYLDRLVELVEKLNESDDDTALTNRERELRAIVKGVKRQPDWDDKRYKQEQIWALSDVEKKHETKATLRGLLYYCMAASELENRPYTLGNFAYTYNEAQNLLDITPAGGSFAVNIMRQISLAHETNHGKVLMGQVYNDLTSKYLTDFEFVKKHKKPTKEEQLAANALAAYYEDNKDNRNMKLIDLAGEDLFKYTFDVRTKKGNERVDMSNLSEKEKSLVRNAAYKFMKEIWGEDEPIFKKKKDGTYDIVENEDTFIGKIPQAERRIRHGGASAIARIFDEDLAQKIKDDNTDQMSSANTKYKINRYYYSSKGTGHDKYEFKADVMFKRSLPFLRSWFVAEDPIGSFENRQFYYSARR